MKLPKLYEASSGAKRSTPRGSAPLEAATRQKKLTAQFAAVLLACIAGCQSPQASHPNGAPTGYRFLGFRESESRKIGYFHPQTVQSAIPDITEVQLATHEAYRKALKEDRIYAREQRNGYVYYAIKTTRDIPFPSGSSALVPIIERYKAKLP